MKPFSERNQLVIGAVGLGITAAIVLGAVNYQRLPFVNPGREYTAYFAEAGGLADNAGVQVSGFKVGQVKSIELDGPRVLVTFTVMGNFPGSPRTVQSTSRSVCASSFHFLKVQ